MFFCGAAMLQTGCHAGGEMLFGSAEKPPVDIGVAQASPAASPSDQKDSPGDAKVVLTAAKAEAPVQGPALITLRAGEDVRHYLEGTHRRVILDFYADWCGPCREQGRVLHQIERVASDTNALIVKINVDQHRDLAEAFSVKVLPTLMVYGDGKILQRKSGLTSAGRLKAWVQ